MNTYKCTGVSLSISRSSLEDPEVDSMPVLRINGVVNQMYDFCLPLNQIELLEPEDQEMVRKMIRKLLKATKLSEVTKDYSDSVLG